MMVVQEYISKLTGSLKVGVDATLVIPDALARAWAGLEAGQQNIGVVLCVKCTAFAGNL